MNASPLVSVIIPCYNQSSYLMDCVDSVVKQSYPHWECIIINDGSTDDTEAIALSLCKKDKRVNYIKKENGGVASARNAGIKNSKGSYILPLDGDDKIGLDYLRLAIDAFKKDDYLSLVYCKAELFGEEKGPWKMPEYNYREMLLFNTIFCSALYLRKDYDRVGGYDETILHGGEDWEFWISLLTPGAKVLRLDSVQFYYRKLKKSRSKDLEQNRDGDIYCRNLIFQKHFDAYVQQFGDPITVYNKFYELDKEIKELKKSKLYKALDNARKLKNRF